VRPHGPAYVVERPVLGLHRSIDASLRLRERCNRRPPIRGKEIVAI
jgi:hypothetical protein